MLSWCSYCQQFGGEVPPYESLAVTHGVCRACEQAADTLEDRDFEHALMLKGVQGRLLQAGYRNDLEAAAEIIEASRDMNLRTVDILLGIIAPMLYRIGEEWKRGVMSVAEEHRFTAFYEQTFELIAGKILERRLDDGTRPPGTEFLLVNAPGNCHLLATRILELWLADKGRRTRLIEGFFGAEDVAALVSANRPRVLLISMALAEQAAGVVAVVARLSSLPAQLRPKIIVGGFAVKQGLVPPVDGAEMIADISLLPLGP